MKYLNTETIAKFDIDGFHSQEGFPYAVINDFLTEEGYALLLHNFPKKEKLNKENVPRGDGQGSHDKYYLSEKDCSGKLSPEWEEFLVELQSDTYINFIRKIYNINDELEVRSDWQMLGNGKSIPPHLDGYGKLSIQGIYFNDPKEWKEEYGGGTTALISKNTYKKTDKLDYDSFEKHVTTNPIGNSSIIFSSSHPKAWHSVKPLTCPENSFRRAFFIVVRSKKLMDESLRKQKVYNFISSIFPKQFIEFARKILKR